ncbi:MAG: hypothetical protein OEQ39_03800 [Gammaproteobacteria bacterium]|nr:hypothetical protein [Gammaproteobacteria bacterium]MDH3466393.1 hypothetical protein [Gammaproteobacteria bacterium]
MTAYSLLTFIEDCRATLHDSGGPDGRERIRTNLEKLLNEPAFLQEHCGADAQPGIHKLHHDSELGFVVLAHIYAHGKVSPPHDHGDSWAIYGQATVFTDMTVWERRAGTSDGHVELDVKQKFRLDPGMAAIFEPGDIHTIDFPAGARFIRVTGTDLSRIPTRRYDLDQHRVTTNLPT